MSAAEKGAAIESRVDGIVTIITINRPEAFNAMDYYHYAALEEHLVRAAEDPKTTVTLLQGTGEFFSAGADVKGSQLGLKERSAGINERDYDERRELQGKFSGRNAVLVDTLWTHPKALVVALNGPVIGLSAAIVGLADFVYARDNSFLLVPFANLSLVTEGATAYTLPTRLGWSLANEALLMSKPIKAQDLYRVGFVNKLYSSDEFPTEKFNETVLTELKRRFAELDFDSVRLIKKLIHDSFDADVNAVSSREVVGGLERFSRGLPQRRFRQMAEKARRHKL